MNSHGTGKIRFVCSSGFPVALKSGNTSPVFGSVSGSQRSLHRVACKVHPFERVRHLIATNTEHNAQDLRLRNELAKGRVKAGATLLDKAEVKGRRVGQCLCVGCWSEIGISYRDGRKHSIGELRNRLSERSAKVRVCRAAIACIPTGVDRELCQVGEAFDLCGPCGLAARQSMELVEVHGLLAAHDQACVQKLRVTLFVESIAGYVLRSVPIKLLESILVSILGTGGDATQLRILLPEVGFNEFGGCQKL